MHCLQVSHLCHLSADYRELSILPSLPVTNNQLALTTPNGHKAIDSLDSSLHGFAHRDPGDDARGFKSYPPTGFGPQRSLR